MILRLPLGPRSSTLAPDSHRLTSMCMEIAGFTHADCPGGYCACKCHTEERTARIAAARQQSQENFDRALPRLGTVNRAVTEYIDGHPFHLPNHDHQAAEISGG